MIKIINKILTRISFTWYIFRNLLVYLRKPNESHEGAINDWYWFWKLELPDWWQRGCIYYSYHHIKSRIEKMLGQTDDGIPF